MGSPHLVWSLITPPKEHAKGVEAATDGSPLPPLRFEARFQRGRSSLQTDDPPNQSPPAAKPSLSRPSVLLLNERLLKSLRLPLLFPPTLTPRITQLIELGSPGTLLESHLFLILHFSSRVGGGAAITSQASQSILASTIPLRTMLPTYKYDDAATLKEASIHKFMFGLVSIVKFISLNSIYLLPLPEGECFKGRYCDMYMCTPLLSFRLVLNRYLLNRNLKKNDDATWPLNPTPRLPTALGESPFSSKPGLGDLTRTDISSSAPWVVLCWSHHTGSDSQTSLVFPACSLPHSLLCPLLPNLPRLP